jgi:hypothetical protein
MRRLLRLLPLVVLAFPAAAHAGDVAMVVRDVPLGPRALQAAQAPIHFNMVGLHWQGSGTVSFRSHLLSGRWTPWASGDAEVATDAGSAEAAATRSWNDSAPAWTGASDRIQFRTTGKVSRLRAYYLWSRVVRTPVRRVAVAGQPTILSRFDWQANERIVRAKPLFAPAIKVAIVHHTVNVNTYSRAQAPAIIRGIETYHVLGNGWNDIGYNFLIDRFGQVWEGRAGGITRNVIGAHTEGFNTGSVGIALIGTYDQASPSPAAVAALEQLLAWRLDVAHVDPLSLVRFTSLGNPRFPRGAQVVLRAISGHRDAYFTDCPGPKLYALLPTIAKAVSKIGLPKIYAPLAQGVAPEAVRFTATLSGSAPWTVTVTDGTGATVATGTGTGTTVDWTWNGTTKAPGPYGWTISAPGARPATGSLGAPAPPAPVASLLGGFTVAPALVAPAANGTGSSATASFTLGAAASVDARAVSAAGVTVATVPAAQLQPGPQTIDVPLGAVPDGRYRIVVTARPVAGGAAVSGTFPVLVDRTVTGFAASTPVVSPNGDGVLDGVSFSFTLSTPVTFSLEIQSSGSPVATVFASAPLGAGPQTLQWNGSDASGKPLPDGAYTAVATWSDAQGVVSTSVPLTVDTTAPQLQLLNPSRLRFSLSEPATVTLLVNGAREVKVEPAGIFAVPLPKAGLQTVTATAQDAGGNVSQPVTNQAPSS